MPETHELIRAAVPTRAEKRRIARALNYTDESTIYKWCEDPEGSGKPNPIDRLDVIIDHALIHQPDAALAIGQRLQGKIARALANRGRKLSVLELVTMVQPDGAREAAEAAGALAEALRQGVLAGKCEPKALLKEVEEAERTMCRIATLLRAAIEAESEVEG